jgi:methyltransferase
MPALGWAQVLVALVLLQRLGELWLAARNTRRLRAAGGIEYGARHYPLIVGLHGAWLASLFFLIPGDTAPNLWLLGVFALLQIARIWVMASLGSYWTTRIIVLPDHPRVRRGPYRFLRHPNYVVVALEIAVLPLAFGAWELALAFTALNAAVLALRIRSEEKVLGKRA